MSTENNSQVATTAGNLVYSDVSRSSRELNQVLRILFLFDPYVDRENIIATKGVRVPGTCEWIKHDQKYCAWLTDTSNGDNFHKSKADVLWISGGPSTGKTMLSIFLTEDLESYTAPTENKNVIFFFCDSHDLRKCSASSLLRGLIYQIISKRPQLVKHAIPYFVEEATQQTLSSLEKLWEIFSKLITDTELGTMFCVLDGLDEGENIIAETLLPDIISLLASNTSPSANDPARTALKLLIISRDIPGLRLVPRIRLNSDDQRILNDVDLFISTRISELYWIEGFKEIRKLVEGALQKKSERSFLWVDYTIRQMSQSKTCAEILEALQDLTDSLPETYGSMLLQIPPQHREVSREILKWAAFAARPLRLQELAEAVHIQTTEQIEIEATISLCRPLLNIDKQEVTLVHQSVRDYLLSWYPDMDEVLKEFRLGDSNANYELMKVCLDCIAESQSGYTTTKMKAQSPFERSPLLHYAVHYWPLHAIRCPMFADPAFYSDHPFFMKNSSLRDFWWAAYSGENDPNRSALYMACSLGVVPWIEELLSRSYKKERLRHSRLGKHENDIQVTEEVLKAAAGNERNGGEVMKLLLDAERDGIYITEELLKTAIRNRSIGRTLVELLLGHQDDIQVTEEVLEAASRSETNGFYLVELLFNYQNNIKITGKVLKAAAGNENNGYGVTMLLLNRQGEKIQITGEVLEAAARNETSGYNLMRLFLYLRGDEIQITQEVLQAAARNKNSGHNLLQLFLDRGDDIQITNEKIEAAAGNIEVGKDLVSSLTGRENAQRVQESAPTIGLSSTEKQGDGTSVISKDTVEMTREQDMEVILNFSDALYECLCDISSTFNGSGRLFGTLLEVKIKEFSRAVEGDNPRDTKELNSRHKVAKAIYRLSQVISTMLARRLLSNDLPPIGAGLESISERSFPELDIPLESKGQKSQKMKINEVENSATLSDTSHNHGDKFESLGSSDSDSSAVHTRPVFAIIYQYFITHPAFEVLISDLKRWIKHFDFDALEHIQQSLHQPSFNALKSMGISHNFYIANFYADWDVLRFLEEHRSYGLNDDLGSVLTITGDSQAAQLETVAKFIHQTWNGRTYDFLPELQKVISCSDGFYYGRSDMRISLAKGKVTVSVRGPMEQIVAVAQQLAWLGAACRPSEEQSLSKTHRYAYYHYIIWNLDHPESDWFHISYVTVPVDKDEPLPSWTCLLDGPCIVSGYPISARSGNQVGLQLPPEFLGIRECVPRQSVERGKEPTEFPVQCFIPGEPNCNLEEIFQSSGQPITLVSLEEKFNSKRSILQYFRRSLVGVKRRHEQTDVEKHGLQSSSGLSHVVAELLDAKPETIEWSNRDPVSRFDAFKSIFEDWTRKEWDWWPLKPPKKELSAGEARLHWISICGEELWAEVPVEFAKTSTELAKACALRIKPLAYSATGQSYAAAPSQLSPQPSASMSSTSTTKNSAKHSQNIGSSSSPSNTSNLGTARSATNSTSPPLARHIFLLVASGNHVRLAQIRVDNLNTYQFFHELQLQYNSLRSFFRRWLSIWVYSHCDFYRCDKYEAHHYEPRKEEFPVGTDYDYDPRPVELMPPISPRQFRDRYYACYDPRPNFHFYHKCKTFNKGTADHLKYFPKRNLNLVEDSDKQEVFWGIFAREKPSILRLLLYHFACAFPCIVFFFLWLFKWGHAGDLQNASVPISVMLAFLSVFWSIYFAHLEIDQQVRRSQT